ncbi:MAG: J domain-containing protein [Myxococcaceae bacterium]|nr:J domain-containing protein [Myxococcaceae bacterium]
MRAVRAVEALSDVEVECTHCGMRMTAYLGSGRRVRYFRCGSCHRWVSSSYADVFRADASVRTRPVGEASADAEFSQVKARLERWLSSLDDRDPYRVLGLSPLASPMEVRERYRELAFRAHPDRGGDAQRMREINLAYERILHHQQQRARQVTALKVEPPELPAP